MELLPQGLQLQPPWLKMNFPCRLPGTGPVEQPEVQLEVG